MRSNRLARAALLGAAALTTVSAWNAAAADTTTYRYDPLGRLIETSYNGQPRSAYTYDAADNRTYSRFDAPTPSSCVTGYTLGSGQTLYAGCELTSPNGAYKLRLQTDGNLVLLNGAAVIWATNALGSQARLVMQSDGNLVVYTGTNAVLWSTGTYPHPGSRLQVGDDGSFHIYEGETDIWRYPTDGPAPCSHMGGLASGAYIAAGDCVSSPNGSYRLSQQSDNLVLYRVSGHNLLPLWSSERAGYVLIMQSDGNLVEFAPGPTPVWSSETYQSNGAHLEITDQGVARLINGASVLWKRPTDELLPGRRILPNDHLDTAGGKCRVAFYSGGVLFYRLSDNHVISYLASEPTGAASALYMYVDGRLVLTTAGNIGILLAPSGGLERPGSRFVAQTDGNLVIYDPNNTPVWASGTAVPGQCE